jgi:hypothetical protein
MASQINHDANSGTLDSGEVANLLRTMQAAQFRKSEKIAEKDTSFKPRSLVDIAFDAEERRKQAQAKQAAEQAEADAIAAQGAASDIAEQPADEGADKAPASDGQTEAGQTEIGQTAMPPPETASARPAEPASITQSQHDEMMAALRAELEAQAQADTQALEAKLSEEHYHRGFEAGQEAAKTAEPTEEEKAHQAHMDAERQDIIRRFNAAIEASARMESADISDIEQAIDFAVRQLASERAGYAISENPEGMVKRISELADNIASQVRVMDVYLNPEDKQVIEKWLDSEADDHGWSLHGAPELASGDIRIVAGGVELTDLLDVETLPSRFTPAPSEPVRPDSSPAHQDLAQQELAQPQELAQQEAMAPASRPNEQQIADEMAESEQPEQQMAEEMTEPEQPAEQQIAEEMAGEEPVQPASEEIAQPASQPAEEMVFAPPATEGEGEFGFPPQPASDTGFAAEAGDMEFAPPATEGEGEFGFPMGGGAIPSDDGAQ